MADKSSSKPEGNEGASQREGNEGASEQSAPATPEEERLSRQAQFSTYQPARENRMAEANPPHGPQTEQHLGQPSEGAVTAFEYGG